MLSNELLLMSIIGICPMPNILIKKLAIYKMPIPHVAATTPSLKFSVTFISLDL